MKITIIGAGYVGLVTGVCLAELGNNVLCLDLDSEKIALLKQGKLPIFEPGLQELVSRNLSDGRLSFTADAKAAATFSTVQFIAVGTPRSSDGDVDLSYVMEAVKNIGIHMTEFTILVNKSTVPVGTGDVVRAEIEAILLARNIEVEFAVVSNPEFLKEGAAIEDFMRPDRIVLGVEANPLGQRALAKLRQLYAPFNRNHERTHVMDVKSSEFTKYAANAMLATRISFMNDLANLAEQVGADIELVRRGIGADPRIGFDFLYPGVGYGGSCFPKDVAALIHSGRLHGSSLRVLEAVQEVNISQKRLLAEKLFKRLGSNLAGKRIAVLGLAFKPNTNDMREAPSREIIKALVGAGARVWAHDPVAMPEAKRFIALDLKDNAPNVEYVSEHTEALQGADALLIVTEWKVYRTLEPSYLKAVMRVPLVIDGRNLYDPFDMVKAGVIYDGIGRGANDMARDARRND